MYFICTFSLLIKVDTIYVSTFAVIFMVDACLEIFKEGVQMEVFKSRCSSLTLKRNESERLYMIILCMNYVHTHLTGNVNIP